MKLMIGLYWDSQTSRANFARTAKCSIKSSKLPETRLTPNWNETNNLLLDFIFLKYAMSKWNSWLGYTGTLKPAGPTLQELQSVPSKVPNCQKHTLTQTEMKPIF